MCELWKSFVKNISKKNSSEREKRPAFCELMALRKRSFFPVRIWSCFSAADGTVVWSYSKLSDIKFVYLIAAAFLAPQKKCEHSATLRKTRKKQKMKMGVWQTWTTSQQRKSCANSTDKEFSVEQKLFFLFFESDTTSSTEKQTTFSHNGGGRVSLTWSFTDNYAKKGFVGAWKLSW